MTDDNIARIRPSGSPLAAAFGATDPDRRIAAIKAVKTRLVATEAVTKAQIQGKSKASVIAVYDAEHRLLGFCSASDLRQFGSAAPDSADALPATDPADHSFHGGDPSVTGIGGVKKSNLATYLKAASAAKRSASRQPDAVQLLKALAKLSLRNRVRKSGEKLGGFDLIATGAAVRSKLPAADRQRFDKLLAKSSADSRRRLDLRLQEAKARLRAASRG